MCSLNATLLLRNAHLYKRRAFRARHDRKVVVVGGDDVIGRPGDEGDAREPEEALPNQTRFVVDRLQLP